MSNDNSTAPLQVCLRTVHSNGITEPVSDGLPPDDPEHRQTGVPKWASLVSAIRGGDPAAAETLYRFLYGGVRFTLRRKLPFEIVDDTVHDTFLIVWQAVQRGRLRKSEKLLGFVWTVAQRQVSRYIREAVRSRKGCRIRERESHWPQLPTDADVEEQFILREQAAIARFALSVLSERDQEILRRFYLKGQSAQQVQSEMNLTSNQFRVVKSRAKARFGAAGMKALLGLVRIPAARERTTMVKRTATGA